MSTTHCIDGSPKSLGRIASEAVTYKYPRVWHDTSESWKICWEAFAKCIETSFSEGHGTPSRETLIEAWWAANDADVTSNYRMRNYGLKPTDRAIEQATEAVVAHLTGKQSSYQRSGA